MPTSHWGSCRGQLAVAGSVSAPSHCVDITNLGRRRREDYNWVIAAEFCGGVGPTLFCCMEPGWSTVDRITSCTDYRLASVCVAFVHRSKLTTCQSCDIIAGLTYTRVLNFLSFFQPQSQGVTTYMQNTLYMGIYSRLFAEIVSNMLCQCMYLIADVCVCVPVISYQSKSDRRCPMNLCAHLHRAGFIP